MCAQVISLENKPTNPCGKKTMPLKNTEKKTSSSFVIQPLHLWDLTQHPTFLGSKEPSVAVEVVSEVEKLVK